LDALASMTETTNQQISHLELGKRRLTIEWLEKIAQALGCHPWALISSDVVVIATEEEQRVLDAFRKLKKLERQAFLARLGSTTMDKTG
jgi:transcriptional regulator with XRE-family HTH domain